MTDTTRIEEGNGLKTPVGMGTKVKGIITWADLIRTEMMQEDERINLLYPLGGDGLVDGEVAHLERRCGEDVGERAGGHVFLL